MTGHLSGVRARKKRRALTLRYLGQMKTVDPGDLAERTRSVEHHHEADWTARPGAKTGKKSDKYSAGI